MSLAVATNTVHPAIASRPVTLPHPVIILGRDDRGKPHASFFPATDCRAAEQAAALMGMLTIRADRDEVRAWLPKLPKGKLFDSGKAFVPFVKQDLYREIAAHLPEDQRGMAEHIRAAASSPKTEDADGESAGSGDRPDILNELPDDWSTLKTGHMVLARESAEEPWYEAIIISVYGNETVRLRWRDYHEQDPFTRRIEELAMLHPAYRVA